MTVYLCKHTKTTNCTLKWMDFMVYESHLNKTVTQKKK